MVMEDARATIQWASYSRIIYLELKATQNLRCRTPVPLILSWRICWEIWWTMSSASPSWPVTAGKPKKQSHSFTTQALALKDYVGWTSILNSRLLILNGHNHTPLHMVDTPCNYINSCNFAAFHPPCIDIDSIKQPLAGHHPSLSSQGQPSPTSTRSTLAFKVASRSSSIA